MRKKEKPNENVKVTWTDEAEAGDTAEDTQSVHDTNEVVDDLAAVLADIEKLKTDAEESHNRYLRAMADFDNYRKRQREEICLRTDQAIDKLLSGILPILDGFERTLDAAKDKHSFEALMEGVEITLKQLRDLLAKEGVEEIPSIGSQFDPNLHEAMMRLETDDVPENTIVAEFEKGYARNGRPLRTAKVQVAAATP